MVGTFILRCMVTFWTCLILSGVWASLTTTQFACIADFVVSQITLTFLGSGSVEIAVQRDAGQCDATATGAVRLVQTTLLLPPLGMPVRIKGGTRARWGETLCLDQATCRPRFGSLRWCLLEDRLVREWGRHHLLLILLWHLVICSEHSIKLPQALMSAEDFSKCEKMVVPPSKEERTKEREQLLWENVHFQKRLRKQEAGHVEQIAKLEARCARTA